MFKTMINLKSILSEKTLQDTMIELYWNHKKNNFLEQMSQPIVACKAQSCHKQHIFFRLF